MSLKKNKVITTALHSYSETLAARRHMAPTEACARNVGNNAPSSQPQSPGEEGVGLNSTPAHTARLPQPRTGHSDYF